MKVSELFEAGKVRTVPAHTFTPRPDGFGGMPGVKGPVAAADNKIRKITGPDGLDMKQKFPVIDPEFGRRLFDKDLVDAIIDAYEISRAEWNKYSALDQIKSQLDFIAPPPRKGDSADSMEAALDKRAKAILAKLKFVTKEAAEDGKPKDPWSQGYFKGLSNYKDTSLKHNPFKKGTKEFNDFHDGFEEGVRDSKDHWE